MLIVLTSDLMAWKRPIQSESHSVLRPNGTFTPTPVQIFPGIVS